MQDEVSSSKRWLRCERHGLHYDPATHKGCIVCNREHPTKAPSPLSPGRLALAGIVIAAAALIVAIAYTAWSRRSSTDADLSVSVRSDQSGARPAVVGSSDNEPPATPNAKASTNPSPVLPMASAAGTVGTLAARNSDGRGGAFYLPAGYAGIPRPLLVLLHGTGGSGGAILNVIRRQADDHRFLVVAPDSRRAPNGEWSWEVGNHPGEDTDDAKHVRACVVELRAMVGVVVDPGHVLIAGYSGGASSAPYIGSNWVEYTAFAVLHGGVVRGGIGSNRLRGWFSTGTSDPIRPVDQVQAHMAYLREAERFTELTFRSFPGGHDLSEVEARAVIEWWLGP